MTPPSETTAHAKLAALSTTLLTGMLDKLREPANAEERMVRAWVIDALEDRFPAASLAVQAAFDAADALITAAPDSTDLSTFEVDRVAVLLGAIPERTSP